MNPLTCNRWIKSDQETRRVNDRRDLKVGVCNGKYYVGGRRIWPALEERKHGEVERGYAFAWYAEGDW